jgi:hypothetical protein
MRSVPSMTDRAREELRDLQLELFGNTERCMPRAFLATVKRGTAQATNRVGNERTPTERDAYWIDNRTLGVLTCKGPAELDDAPSDEQVVIRGHIFQLDELTVHLSVVTRYDTRTHTSSWCRVLTIGDEVTLDAWPNVERMEQFIDDVLDAVAGRVSRRHRPYGRDPRPRR